MNKICISFFILFLPFVSFGQKAKTFVEPETKDSTVIIVNKLKYKKESNWIIAGAGWNVEKLGLIDGNMQIDGHFKFKKKYYQIGLVRGKEYFDKSFFPVQYKTVYNELHVGLFGYRKESVKTFMAAFAGVSYMVGEYSTSDTALSHPFGTPGLHANLELIYKPVFDIGIGVNFWGTANFKYSVAGIGVVLYFSNAFNERIYRSELIK